LVRAAGGDGRETFPQRRNKYLEDKGKWITHITLDKESKKIINKEKEDISPTGKLGTFKVKIG